LGSHGPADPGAIAALGNSELLPGLRRLSLNGFAGILSGPSSVAFGGSRLLPGLVSLEVTRCDLDDAGLAALAASPAIRGLRSLGLPLNPRLGSAGIAALAASPWAGELRQLDLWDARLDDEAVLALVRSPHLRDGLMVRLRISGAHPPPCGEAAYRQFLQRFREWV
jgi:hypothetical protein